METRVGETPDEANGWGILDHGVGCMEKVRVVGGRTVDVDMGQEIAFVYIGGPQLPPAGRRADGGGLRWSC